LNLKKLSKKTPVTILRFLIATVPLVWICYSVDWSRLPQTLHSIAWWALPLLFFINFIGILLQGLRWWMLMLPFAPKLSLTKTMAAHFLGLYYSIVLPTSAAQDAVRAGILSKHTKYSLSWASTWVSRLLGLLTLGILSLYGLFGIKRSMLPPYFMGSAIITFILIVILVIFSFSKIFTSPIRKTFGRLIPVKILKTIENIRESVYQYRRQKKNLLIVFGVTMIMQIIIFAGSAIVLMGISGKFLLSETLLYLPIIEVICMSIPLTPNGIGFRETMLALMFNQVGLTKEHLAIYIVMCYLLISLKLIGGLPLLINAATKLGNRNIAKSNDILPK
jgi:uncharacterized protein (TIRG00374 family)